MTNPRPQDYSDVATLRGQTSLLYQEFGSYQGEWLCFARDESKYYIYKGWYGSCSGCDDIQSRFGWGDDEVSDKELAEWLAEYPAFIDMPRPTAGNLAKSGRLMEVFPRNMRDDYSDIPLDDWAAECTFVIKLEEGLDISPAEILAVRNLENRRRALDRTDISSFVADLNGIVVDADTRGDRLVSIRGDRYLWLLDGSTDRQYLLRVPPETATVLDGKAWSFDIPSSQYAPVIET